MSDTEPKGELVIRAVAMPSETNPNGDIFGGWILSQMDLGGACLAKQIAKNRVVTVAIERMEFLHPVKIGDFVSCYASVAKIGRTSIVIQLETWVSRYVDDARNKVTEGCFTYVAIDAQGKPTAIASTSAL